MVLHELQNAEQEWGNQDRAVKTSFSENQSIQTNSELAQFLELMDKDIKMIETEINMLKKIEYVEKWEV